MRAWLDDLDDEVRAAGRSPAAIRGHLDLLRRGLPHADVLRPCVLGDGIDTLSPHHEALGRSVVRRALAFVPASGAATRLFASWREAIRRDDPSLAESVEHARELAILEAGGTVLESLCASIERWGDEPKALLPAHGPDRTLLQDHLDEADALGLPAVHFTTSEAHRAPMEAVVAGRATVSVQDPTTDTLAFTPDLRPLRDEWGQVAFRPSGHGALLPNLDAVAQDLVLVKNVDNVVHPDHRDDVLRWRLRMLGRLSELHGEVLSVLQRGSAMAAQILLRSRFGVIVPERRALEQLDRPLRVCGMVPDRGELGGGPYWVADADGIARPQILEGCQLHSADAVHAQALADATHFNPADMALAVLGPSGRWPLAPFVDPDQAMRVQRSVQGRDAVAIERPGLWNGSMAGWNTLFVELPAEVFQPVKTIGDLLRPAHRARAEGGRLV